MNKWMVYTLLAVILAVPLAGPAFGRTVLYSGKAETVTVLVGTPTIVRFEKPVKTVSNAQAFVIRPASDESPDYTTLAIDARRAGGASLATFILADGQIVRAKLVATSGAPSAGFDNVIDFKTDEAGATPLGGAAPGADVKPIELMKAIVRGDRVMGYEIRDLQKSLLRDNRDVKATLIKVYQGGELTGYVIHLANTSTAKTYRVDIRSLRVGEPDLAVLSQIDRSVLAPPGGAQSETELRVVARSGGVYKDMVLPVSPVKREKGGGP